MDFKINREICAIVLNLRCVFLNKFKLGWVLRIICQNQRGITEKLSNTVDLQEGKSRQAKLATTIEHLYTITRQQPSIVLKL